jgi:hypothetical protein
MFKRKPRKEDEWDLLIRGLERGSSSRAIMDQEKTGQESFVESTTLPTVISGKEILEAAGVKFLGLVEDDALFQYVQLPAGWKKVATDHSMWSTLVDEKGRERASIFYKAASYDRRAFATATELKD